MSDLTETLKKQWAITNGAQQRAWDAEDKVNRLRAQLASAEAELSSATRSHEKHAGILTEVWTLVRKELERIPVVDTVLDENTKQENNPR